MESDCERVLAILDQLGIEYKREAGNRAKICCPFHDEKTPSFTIYDTNSCYCFGCQKRCWHDELIAKVSGCSLIEAKKKLGTYDPNVQYICSSSTGDKLTHYDFAEPAKDFSQAFPKLPDDVPDHMKKFLENKAIDKVAFNLGKWRWHPKGTLKCWPNQEGIAIPYFGPNGEICTFRLRRYDRMREKYGHPLAPKGVPLQCSYLVHNKKDVFYFCEGESDSLSMYSIGKNVICLPGVGAHKQLHSAIMQLFDWGVNEFVFCGDNDQAGKEFNKYAVNATLDLGMGIYRPQIRVLKLPEEYNTLKDGSFKRKDINDFLVEGRLKNLISDFEANNLIGKTNEYINMIKQNFGAVETMPESELEGVF